MKVKGEKILSKVSKNIEKLGKEAKYSNKIHNKLLMYIYDDIKIFLPNLDEIKTICTGGYKYKFKNNEKNNCLVLGPSQEGKFEKELSNHFHDIVCADGSIKIINDAKEKLPDYTFIHSLFEDLKFDKKFDFIFMLHILEHIEYPHILLNLLKFWLKDNGRIVIAVPNAYSLHRILGKKMGILKDEHDLSSSDISVGHKRVYDEDLLRKDIQKAGFDIPLTLGVFVKPFNNKFMENLSDEQLDGFYQLGKDELENKYCADIVMMIKDKTYF